MARSVRAMPGSRTVCPMSSGPSGQSSPAPGSAWTRWLASASMIEAGKPSSASSIAGASTSAEGQPAVALVQGQPAVDGAGHLHAADVTAQRHGRHAPRRAGRAASEPAPARPTTSSASGGDPGRRRPWPGRRRPGRTGAGPTTAMAAPVATAASAAEPPRASMAMPAEAASWSAAATMPRSPVRGAEGGEGSEVMLRGRPPSAAPRRAACGRRRPRRRRCRSSR